MTDAGDTACIDGRIRAVIDALIRAGGRNTPLLADGYGAIWHRLRDLAAPQESDARIPPAPTADLRRGLEELAADLGKMPQTEIRKLDEVRKVRKVLLLDELRKVLPGHPDVQRLQLDLDAATATANRLAAAVSDLVPRGRPPSDQADCLIRTLAICWHMAHGIWPRQQVGDDDQDRGAFPEWVRIALGLHPDKELIRKVLTSGHPVAHSLERNRTEGFLPRQAPDE